MAKLPSGWVLVPKARGDGSKITVDIEQSELVMCKDCVYWQDNNDGYPHKDCKWNQDETPDPDDYCSGGVPKD